MIGSGYVWHWGTVADSFVLTEAINAVPLWWLKHGLPQLRRMLYEELTPYMRLRKEFAKRVAARKSKKTKPDDDEEFHGLWWRTASLLFCDAVSHEFARLVPVAWLRAFVRVTLYHLRAYRGVPTPADTEEIEFKAPKFGMHFRSLSKANGLLGEDFMGAIGLLEEVADWLQTEEAIQIVKWQTDDSQ